MARMARELRALGHDVISLSLGEPDFDTPDHIKDAATQALKEGYTKYTPVAGLPELTKAISEKFKRDNGLDYRPEQIVVSNGAKQTVYNLCQSLLNPGDEAILFSPYWVSYYEIVKMSGGVPVMVYAGVERDFKPSAQQLEAAITAKTKFVLFSSPCNPTGSVYTREELKAYADVLANYPDVVVISDEIYEYINFTHEHVSIGSFPAIKDRTVTINGFAKGFAMTGWRLGYMGAPKYLADACAKIQGQVTSGASSFGQKAGAVALMSSLQATEQMREAFRERRDIVISMLEEIPGIKTNHPDGAFYIFPDISSYFGKTDGQIVINNADDFCDYIMTSAYVGLVSGSAFGDPNCFRLSYAASEEQLREAVRRMREVLARLK
ncbi:MAG: pyridoxal phosphate-dependent aminotransferase [Saprospiraceae bacterium]|nr:pyridoxal phosphate-dependent aminotransferase [Saprospiraceae bacterium]